MALLFVPGMIIKEQLQCPIISEKTLSVNVVGTIVHQRKKSNYHALQLSKFTSNLWVDCIKKTCLFPFIKQNARQKNGIIEYFSTFLLYLLSMHGQYIEKLEEMVHCLTSLSELLDVSLVLQVTAMTKFKNYPKKEDRESEPIRFQMISNMMWKITSNFKLMVQLKDVNRLDTLAEADSCARNAKLFFVLLAVNAFWSFMVRYEFVFLYLKL